MTTSPERPEKSAKYVLVAAAWPYANGDLHVGQIAGCYLPADIYARYHRMKGNHTLMVSGSDSHGTPVTVRAEQEGVEPTDIFKKYHESFLDTFQRFGISFDLFTHTDTDNHSEVTHDIFLKLLENDYLYEAEQTLLYDVTTKRFLPDRYVEGECPHCNFDHARGDQCDNCGRTLDALELINPRSKLSNSEPEPRNTSHHFLRLSAFNEQLIEWIESKDHWRPAVRNFTLGMLREGLHDRAITRDIEWGIDIPLSGYESKRIYVWFEAVIGYLSATIEWAKNNNNPDAWKQWWENPDALTTYFQGKDNIPFHAIIWPAMLMGYGNLNLPYNIPANQYVTMSGSKASTSGNWAVWMPDYLNRHEPDPLRYVLTALMPETSDSDFTWTEYVRRNNDELVARWGNLVHRVLTMTYRNFNGEVPSPPEQLSPESLKILDEIDSSYQVVGNYIEKVELRNALAAIMDVAQKANQYLTEREPWKKIKSEPEHAAETLHTALNVISGLISQFQPFLPFSCEKAWKLLGQTTNVQEIGWKYTPILPGTILPEPSPLFEKFDESLIEQEENLLGS